MLQNKFFTPKKISMWSWELFYLFKTVSSFLSRGIFFSFSSFEIFGGKIFFGIPRLSKLNWLVQKSCFNLTSESLGLFCVEIIISQDFFLLYPQQRDFI